MTSATMGMFYWVLNHGVLVELVSTRLVMAPFD
jgi:hypothetical protein